MDTNLKKFSDAELLKAIHGTIEGARMAANDAAEAMRDKADFLTRLERMLDEVVGRLTSQRPAASPPRKSNNPNGAAPFGYRIEAGQKFPYEPEQEVLKAVREMQGNRLGVIVAELNRRGLTTRRGKSWDLSSLSRLMSRHFKNEEAPA